MLVNKPQFDVRCQELQIGAPIYMESAYNGARNKEPLYSASYNDQIYSANGLVLEVTPLMLYVMIVFPKQGDDGYACKNLDISIEKIASGSIVITPLVKKEEDGPNGR